MATTTSSLDDVKLITEKAVFDAIASLMDCEMTEQDWESFNYSQKHLTSHIDDLRIWMSEVPAPPVYAEFYDPPSDTAYEEAEISLDYYADPNEEVVKPSDVELEALLAHLTTLPDR